jgi:hypothetical protein
VKTIRINFNQQHRYTKHIIGVLLLVAAIVGLAMQTWEYFKLYNEAEVWKADQHRLRHILTTTNDKSPLDSNEYLRTELQLSNRIIDKLNMPWDALFTAIETTADKQAILLGVEPDAERREVVLTGEAKDATAMLSYIRELRSAPVLKNAYLTAHQINLQDPQRPVHFTIDANWANSPLSLKATSSVAKKGHS